MQDERGLIMAYLTELRGELSRDIDKFKSGAWKLYAGGSELSDVTAERISSLERRIREIDLRLLGRG